MPPKNDFEIQDLEKIAIQRFLLGVTVPLIYDSNTGPALLATGTLFERKGHRCIATAKHVFEGIKRENVAIPEAPQQSALMTLGEFDLYLPQDTAFADFDVAVVHLKSDSVLSKLANNWRFVGEQHVKLPSQQGTFVVAGFPGELSNSSEVTLSTQPMTVFSQRMTETPPNARPPVNMAVDMFFYLDKAGTTAGGKEQKIPSFPGMSGASVWQYHSDEAQPVWSAEACLKVGGVQASALKDQFFRAKQWSAVMVLLDAIKE